MRLTKQQRAVLLKMVSGARLFHVEGRNRSTTFVSMVPGPHEYVLGATARALLSAGYVEIGHSGPGHWRYDLTDAGREAAKALDKGFNPSD